MTHCSSKGGASHIEEWQHSEQIHVFTLLAERVVESTSCSDAVGVQELKSRYCMGKGETHSRSHISKLFLIV
jgi:hypothetical protein